MSMILTARAMSMRVGSPLRKLVLMKLCDNANDRGQCWPSMQYIASHCEMTTRSVVTHINELEKAGFLKVYQRATKGKKISNYYVLTLDNALQPEPQTPPEAPPEMPDFLPVSSENNSLLSSENPSLLKPVSSENGASSSENPSLLSSENPSHKPVSKPVNKATSHKNLLVHGYPDWFETLWKNYPPRQGSQDKRKAYSACCARIKSGVTGGELHAAVARYGIFCRATGKWGTEFVLQAATFFGPGGHIQNPWQVGPAVAARSGGGAGPPGSRSTRDISLAEQLTDRSWAK